MCAISAAMSVFVHEVEKTLETQLVEVSFESALFIMTGNGHYLNN